MFKIKYFLDKSQIHGIGLFANQNIQEGNIVYVHNKDLDKIISQDEFERLELEEKRIFKHYGYFNPQEGVWRLDHDDIRFCNHSENSNITLVNGKIIAKRNIKRGEELLQDYSEFGGLIE